MSAHWIPNLRRDLPISVVLLLMAVAAVVPRVVAVIIVLAGITGLMLHRLTMGRTGSPTRSGHHDTGGNMPSGTARPPRRDSTCGASLLACQVSSHALQSVASGITDRRPKEMRFPHRAHLP